MSISKFNPEGYFDPTAYEALTTVEMEVKAAKAFRPLVYICSPYSGDIERNTEAARRYSRFAVDSGYIPITPHLLYPQFMNEGDQQQRELGLRFALVLLGKCDELWVFGSHISSGMKAEIDRAKRKCYTIRYFLGHCKEADVNA